MDTGTPVRLPHPRRTGRSCFGTRSFWCKRTQTKTRQHGQAGLKSCQLQLHRSRRQQKFVRLKPSGNMVLPAVAPLDSTVLLVRFFSLLPMVGLTDAFGFADVHSDLERDISRLPRY